jgi:chromosome segregation ATPase
VKILTWFAGILFLLAAGGTAVLPLVEEASMVQAQPQVVAEQPEEAPPAISYDGVRNGLKAVASILEEEGNRVEVSTKKSLTAELQGALRLWDTSSVSDTSLTTRIVKDLGASRRAHKLDVLLLVTQDDRVLSDEAPGGGDTNDPGHLSVVAASEPFFRDGKTVSGVETLPARYASSHSPSAGSECLESNLFLFTCVPLWLRPDSPQAVLIGGVSVHTLSPRVRDALAEEADGLLWHVFAAERDAEPVVIAGDGVGTPLRHELYQDLLRNGMSSAPAFAQSRSQLGNWVLARNAAGQAVGGWGVTRGGSNDKPSAPSFGGTVFAGTGQSEDQRQFPRSWLQYLGSATVLSGGLFALLAFYVLHGQRSVWGRATATKSGSTQLTETGAPVPVADDLVSQFEINWKTFASYTQDLFHRKLRELDGAPQKGVSEVQEQVTHLSEALIEVRDNLSVVRREIADTTQEMIAKLTGVLEQGSHGKGDSSETGEALLGKLEADFDKASQRFSQLDEAVLLLTELFGRLDTREIEERVTKEVERQKEEWNRPSSAGAGGIEAGEAHGQSLVQDLEHARGVEAELRQQVEEASRREQTLAEQLAEKLEKLDTSTKERAGARRRERRLAEELRTVREAEENNLQQLDRLKQTVRDLEASCAEAKACEEQFRRDLEAATIKEEKYRETIKEIYCGESCSQKDLEEKETELATLRAESQSREEATVRSAAESEARWGARVEDLESTLENAHKELVETATELSESERKRSKSAEAQAESERKLSGSAEERAESERKLSESTETLAESERKRSDSAEAQAELERKLSESAEAQAESERKLSESTEALAESERKRSDSAEAQAELERKLSESAEERAESERKLSESTEALAESERKRSESAEERAESERKLSESTEALAELERKRSESAEAQAELERKLSESAEQRAESERKLSESAEAQAESERKLSESVEELEDSERELLELQKKLAQSEAALRKLQAQPQSQQVSPGAHAAAVEPLSSAREQELVRSLEQIGKELEVVRREKGELELESKVQGLFRENLTRSLPALVVVDGQRRVMSWNQNAESLLGVPENDALGEDFFSLYTPLKKEAFQQLFEKAKQGSATRKTRVRFESGGVPGQYLVTQSPFLGKDASVRGTVLLIQELVKENGVTG